MKPLDTLKPRELRIVLESWRTLVERTTAWAAQLPYREISNEHGELYIRRFYFAGAVSASLFRGWPERPYPVLGDLPYTVLLHNIVRPDEDRRLHNHPWHAAGMILRGGYIEERADGKHVRRRGDMLWLAPDTYHRITEVQPGTWTLFVHGPRVQEWGFL